MNARSFEQDKPTQKAGLIQGIFTLLASAANLKCKATRILSIVPKTVSSGKPVHDHAELSQHQPQRAKVEETERATD